MIKRFAYIVLLLILAPCLSFAHTTISGTRIIVFLYHKAGNTSSMAIDTSAAKRIKQQEEEKKKQEEEKKKQEANAQSKIKEIAKAKHQVKPEKVDEPATTKAKAKRERRPEGLERPPEIPRRNGN